MAVPAAATYITGTSVTVTVSASKSGFTAPSDVTRTLTVDLTAPSASYTVPATLKVGVAIGAMAPSTSDTDIASYGATGLPSGLDIDTGTGVISGTPDTATTTAASVTVTVNDTAGNDAEVTLTFPAVAKGDQTLSGFEYSSDSVTLGGTPPNVRAPDGAEDHPELLGVTGGGVLGRRRDRRPHPGGSGASAWSPPPRRRATITTRAPPPPRSPCCRR